MAFLVAAFLGAGFCAQPAAAVAPDQADVRYGKFDRNVLDVYLPPKADDAELTPVLIHLHGGGWLMGDKRNVKPTPYLKQGIAVVSANYRFTMGSRDSAPYPAPMNDSARVVQYVRSRAKDWNLDPDRVALSGSSAGAVNAMWVAYQDDMAKPESEDPIERFSTRVSCVLPSNTPTTMDPRWILKHVGGPKQIHVAAYPLFRIQTLKELETPENEAKVRGASPVSHVTSDDPPTYIRYGMPLGVTPLPETADQNVSIHHPRFGQYLKECMDQAGVKCVFRYRGDQGTLTQEEFLKEHL